MPSFVVRVWLPDRPGALGAVASRIGAVRGDVSGIESLERGAGRAIDELVVELSDAALVDLLVAEIAQVDGCDVEDVRPAPTLAARDPRLEALETAAVLVEQAEIDGLLVTLVRRASHDSEASWCVVADVGGPVPGATMGTPPSGLWLGALLAGSLSSARLAAGECGPDGIAWAPMPTAALWLVIGREGRPYRRRERRQLAALARIADARWAELAARAARLAHPSAASSSLGCSA